MDLTALISSYRELSGDHGVPAFRTDAQVAALLSEGQREAAQRARLLPDKTTPAVVDVALVEDQYDYPLHASIFDVVAVWLDNGTTPTRRRKLDRALEGDISAAQQRGGFGGWARSFDVMGEPGSMILRLDRAPNAAGGALKLEVFRYPLLALTTASMGASPEIAPNHHRGLVHWALKCVYETRDLEISAPDRARYHEGEFIKLFGERDDANVMRQKRRHRAPVVRPARF